MDRATLLARVERIRQFARGSKRSPHKPLLLLYALGRLKHDRQKDVRFRVAEEVLRPLISTYGPWGSQPRLSYPYGRLETDQIWRLAQREVLLDAKGNVREAVARAQDARAGFTNDVLDLFAREPELIDVVAVHLLELHFATSLHDEVLQAAARKSRR